MFPFHGARRLVEVLLAASCLLMAGGCATEPVYTKFDVWRSATNECYAVYRHEWSAVSFVTTTSRAPFQIVIPVPGSEQTAPAETRTTTKEHGGQAALVTTAAQTTGTTPPVTGGAAAKTNAVPASQGAVSVGETKTEQRTTDATAQSINSDTRGGATAKVQAGQTHANTYGSTTKSEVQTAGSTASSASAGQVASVRTGSAKSQMKVSSGSSAQQFSAATSVAQRSAAETRQYQSEVQTRAAFPLLSLEKKAVTAQVTAGHDITFSFVLKNEGDLNLRDIAVMDPGIEGLTFASIENISGNSVNATLVETNGFRGVTFNIRGTLGTGTQAEFSARYHTPARDAVK